MTSGFIFLDGNYFPSSNPVFTSANRAFRYGDGIFETIRIINGNICFLGSHFARIKKGISLLGYEYPQSLTEDILASHIRQLLEKNNINKDGRLRLVLFRNEGGYYTPQTNQASLLLEVEPLNEEGYNLNIKGLTVDIFPDYKKTRNALSSIKTSSSLIYVLAGVYKVKNKLDDCILLNSESNIVEAINSNIFAVKNGVLYTPPLEEGCVNGIMREQILNIAQQNRISVYEIELKMNVLLNSDEVFFTNAVKGIQWVGAYKTKRYYNNTSRLLVEKLNNIVMGV